MDPQSLLADGDFVRALARSLIADARRVDPRHADDAAQETWLAILRRNPNDPPPVAGWFATVVRNAARQLARAERRRQFHEKAAGDIGAHGQVTDVGSALGRAGAVPSAAEVAEREAARRAVVEELMTLEETYRAVLLLRFYDQLPPREVARRLGIPVETARTRIRRGLERLREALDARAPGGREAWGVSLVSLAGLRGAGALPAVAGGLFLMNASTKAAGVLALAILGIGLGWLLWPSPGGPTPGGGAGGGGTPTIASATAREKANETGNPTQTGPESAKSARTAAETATRRVTGRVVDLEGHPVANAIVAAGAYPPKKAIVFSDAVAGRNGARAVRAAADGRFDIPLGAQEVRLTLGAEAAGFAPAFVEIATPGEEVTIRLERALALTGRIVDEDGAPVANAKITWSALYGLMGIEREGYSDARGNYRVEGLPSASQFVRQFTLLSTRVVIRAPGYAPVCVARDGVTMSGRPSLARDWVLNRGVTLRGRVVDDESDAPIPEARVVFCDSRGMGSYQFNGVHISNPFGGTILLEGKTDGDGNFAFEHAPGSSLYEDRIAGEVTKSGRLVVVSDGYRPIAIDIEAEAVGSVVERDLRLRPNATIPGRVVDELGAPLANVYVFAPSDPGRGGWVPDQFASEANGSGTTGADGRYSLKTVEAFTKKDRTVTVRASVYDGRRLLEMTESGPARNEAEVTVRAGKIAEAPDLVVPRAALRDSGIALPKEASIVAKVVDKDGAPLAGVVVQPLTAGLIEPRTTGPDGIARFVVASRQLSGDAGALVTVVASAPGYAQADSGSLIVFSGDTKEISLVLKRGKSVRGRVLRANGAPADAARVSARLVGDPPPAAPIPGRGPTGMVAFAVTLEDGSFEMANAPDTMLVLTAATMRRGASGQFDRVTTSSETVAAGANDVVLRFTDDADFPAGSLDVVANDASNGKPILRFFAALLRGSRSFGAAPGVPGQVHFDGIVPGEYELRVAAEGYATETVAPVSIAVDGQQKITVALGHGATVRGKIDAPSGFDFSTIEVLIERLNRGASRIEPTRRIPVEADGSYRILNVAPGKWRVRAVDWRDIGSENIPSAKWATVGDPIVTAGAVGTEIVCDLEIVAGGTLQIEIVGKAIAFDDYSGTRPTDEQIATTEASKFTVRDAKGTLLFSMDGLDTRILAIDRGVPAGEVIARLEVPGRAPLEKRATITVGKRTKLTFDVN